MAAPADLSKGTDRVFDTQRTSWYELAPQNRAKGGLAFLGGMFERKPEVVERMRSSSDGSDEEDDTIEEGGNSTDERKETIDGKEIKRTKKAKHEKEVKDGKKAGERKQVEDEKKSREKKKGGEGKKVKESKGEKGVQKGVKGKNEEHVLKQDREGKQKQESPEKKDKDRKEAKAKSKAKSDKGVYIHLQLEKYHSHRFDKVLVMGILQALHKFRERPYQGQLLIKGKDGFEYGVGCIGDRNGSCA